MSAADEIVQIVDGENREVGTAPRREMRANRLLHRCTYIFVFDAAGELFVQLRTPVKDIYPGYFDLAAGGVVNAGESYDMAAVRELEEELGITGVPLTPHGEIYFEDERSRVFGRIYSCVYEGPMWYQPEEVVSGKFVPIPEIFARVQRGENITPDTVQALRHYLNNSGTGVSFP